MSNPTGTAEPAISTLDERADLLSLIDRLLPKASAVQISDVSGVVYTIPGSAPARRQLRVFALLEDVTRHFAALAPALDALRDGDDLGRALGAIVAAVAGDEKLLDLLDRIFEAAHPGVLTEARAAQPEDLRADGNRPSDLFAVEEIVASLVPFFGGAIRRLAPLASIPIPTPTTAVN